MTLFSDLKLDPKVLKAIDEAGYQTPTPIQAGAIPPALEGRDVLGIAQTGTGKTASFTLPMITLLGRGRARARMPRSLVLCPTRELAAQVAENFDIYAKHTRLTKALLIGGVSFGEQDKLIDRGVDVLIATPGRLLDHFERGKLLLTGVQIMVVDEADRMLDMGFIPDIERIFQLTPFTRQTLFFSATMAPEIERITNTFLHAPERIEVARQATTSETITQKLIELAPTRKDQTAKQKRELLRALIDAEGETLKNAIIFCNRKTEVDIVAKSLKAHGYDAAPIHGDLDQRVRMATLDGFRDGTLRFLVASDVAARGLDIPAVSHVFNFDLPSHAEDYVHRIGRTGRAGRLGTAISISTPSDEKYLSAIENLVKQALPRAEAPEGFSLSEASRAAPRERSERPERGTRARGGRRRGGPTDGPRPAEDSTPVAESARIEKPAEAAVAPAPQRDEAPAPKHDRDNRRGERRDDRADRDTRREDRNDHRRDGDRRDDRRDGDRREERRDGDRRDRNRDRGPSVLGMGDHVPDFLLTSFRPALAAMDARAASTEAEAEAQGKPVVTESAEPKKQAPKPSEPVVTQPAEQPAENVAPVETPQDAAEAAPEAAPTKPRRTRRKKAAPAADAVSVTDAQVEAVLETPADSAEAPAPKPRRTRARRKPVEAPLPEEVEAAQPESAPVLADPVIDSPMLVPASADALPEEREAIEAARVEDAPAPGQDATGMGDRSDQTA